MKLFVQNNDIEMYSTHTEGKSAIAERFIGTLRNKINTWLQIQKIDKLDDIVDIIIHTRVRLKWNLLT